MLRAVVHISLHTPLDMLGICGVLVRVSLALTLTKTDPIIDLLVNVTNVYLQRNCLHKLTSRNTDHIHQCEAE